MKKILILISILTISLTSFAQSDDGIKLCDIEKSKKHATTLTINQLLKCGELTPNDDELNIISFLFVMNADGGEVLEIKTSGNKFSEKMIAEIKKHKPFRIYIREIIAARKKGTIQKLKSHTIKLKK